MTNAALRGALTPTDVPVIVGAGLAGLTVALHLAPLPCVVLCAGQLGGECASGWAQGGIAAALGSDDSPELHALDTLQAGAGLCEPDVVRRITAAAPAAVDGLAALGARFDRHNGDYIFGLEGAHSRHRIVHAGGDGSGDEILRAVVTAVRATASITVLEGVRARRLVMAADGAGVAGVAVQGPQGASTLRASRVVLATGGVGGLWAHTTNPLGAQGQGLALAARAGAVLRDLEMVQFHPTALDVGRDPMPLVSEAVRGEGAQLVDEQGAALVADPLAARDLVARALWQHASSGQQAYVDARSALGGRFAEHFPAIAAACLQAGIDPATDLMPVRPAAHYHCGGVLVDEHGRSTVPGLWACGEVASTGLHGANRLASNSLLEAVVCGQQVAADLTRPLPLAATGRRSPQTLPEMVLPPATTEAQLRSVRQHLDTTVGIVRHRTRVRGLVDDGQEQVLDHGPDATDDARLVALLVGAAALRRGESLGGHRWAGPVSSTTRPDSQPQHTLTRMNVDGWVGVSDQPVGAQQTHPSVTWMRTSA